MGIKLFGSTKFFAFTTTSNIPVSHSALQRGAVEIIPGWLMDELYTENCIEDGTPPDSPHIDHPTAPDSAVTMSLLPVSMKVAEEVSGRLTSKW